MFSRENLKILTGNKLLPIMSKIFNIDLNHKILLAYKNHMIQVFVYAVKKLSVHYEVFLPICTELSRHSSAWLVVTDLFAY